MEAVYRAALIMFEDDKTLKTANIAELRKSKSAHKIFLWVTSSYPKEDFMCRLRDIASKDTLTSWGSSLVDGMYNFIPPSVPIIFHI